MTTPRPNLRRLPPLDPFEKALRDEPLPPPPAQAMTLRWGWFWIAMAVGSAVWATGTWMIVRYWVWP